LGSLKIIFLMVSIQYSFANSRDDLEIGVLENIQWITFKN
jgi:hypothetical protein